MMGSKRQRFIDGIQDGLMLRRQWPPSHSPYSAADQAVFARIAQAMFDDMFRGWFGHPDYGWTYDDGYDLGREDTMAHGEF